MTPAHIITKSQDNEGMENALRTLEDVPLKGLNLRLEKDDSANGGGGAGDRPFRADHQRPRYNDGPPQGGPRGGYEDRFGPGGPRGYDRDSRDSRGGYERGPYGGGGGDRYHQGPPMDRFDGPPPYRGGGYADYRMGGPGGPDPRGGGGYRGDRSVQADIFERCVLFLDTFAEGILGGSENGGFYFGGMHLRIAAFLYFSYPDSDDNLGALF